MHKNIALMGILTAFSIILSYVESLIPIPFVIPGIKLGIANVVTLFSIMYLGFGMACAIVFIRCLLTALLFSGVSGFLFSVFGAVSAIIVMGFLHSKFSDFFSLPAISVAGAVAHNIGQLVTAAVIIRDIRIFSYLPVLSLAGTIAGFFVGVCVHLLDKRIGKLGFWGK